MAQENQFLKFKLLGNKKPVSWELPITSQMFVKKDENGRTLGRKRIHYIQGANGIFVEDYKGDEKSKKVFFEEGVLRVNKYDVNLLEILKSHRLNGKKFEMIDEDRQALDKLSKNQLIKKALNKVDISNEDELKANALIIVGPHVVSWTEPRVRAALEDKAFNSPKLLLETMDALDYKSKYIASLAILRDVLYINPGRTAVLWTSTGDVLVHVPMGKDPVHIVGLELSKNDEATRVTLQEIDRAIVRSYNKSHNATATNEIADLTSEKGKKDISLSAEEQELENVRNEFEEVLGRKVPTNKKNDIEWLRLKIEKGDNEDE